MKKIHDCRAYLSILRKFPSGGLTFLKTIVQKNAVSIALGCGLLIVSLLIAAVTFLTVQKIGIDDLRTKVEGRLDFLSTTVFFPAEKYSYLPSIVAEFTSIVTALQHPKVAENIKTANELLERLNTEAGSTVIYVMDTTGLTIASSNWRQEKSFIGNNYSFRPYFIDAMRDGSGYFDAMGLTSGVPGHYISYAVKEHQKVLGIVVVKIGLSQLDEKWKNFPYDVIVTDKTGIAFLSSREEWRYRLFAKLSASSWSQLKQTRQYDGVLREPIPISSENELRPGERIVNVTAIKHWYGDETEPYYVKSRAIPRSDWIIRIFISLDEVNRRAREFAFMAVFSTALLALFVIWANQTRLRIRERKESRLALQEAYRSLEKNHEELHQLAEELRIKSITDPLTGVFNRRFFLESAVKMVHAGRRHDYPVSVILIDVDYFKRVNDTYGHPIGDMVLQAMVALSTKELREADIFARFGGEEFVLALPHTDKQAAHIVAERIRTAVMNHPIEIENESLHVTISCGIAQCQPTQSIKDTISQADQALYQAKQEGRNRIVIA